MSLSRYWGCAGLIAVLAATIVAQDKTAAPAAAQVPQTLCPIMGEKISLSVYADYQGKRIYFCCPGCIAEFKKTPENMVKQMESKGIILDAAQVACPVTGGKVDRQIYVDHGGRRIYFSSKDCVAKFNVAPEQYVKKLDQETAAAAGK
jgi:YHS domain-containing protein